MTSLSGRPLLDHAADASLFVDREPELRRLRDAVDRRLNAAVVGPRGIGTTSLLRRLQAGLRPRVAVAFVVGESAGSLPDLLALVAAELRVEPADPATALRGEPTATERLLALVHALHAADRAYVLLDGYSSARDAHTLFGRLRDELWTLPLRWIVAVPDADRGVVLAPPADAFFDTVVELGPLPPAAAAALVRARVDPTELSDDVLADVVTAGAGVPRALVAAARAAVAEPGAGGRLGAAAARRRALAERVGRPAEVLLAELDSLGPVSAGDRRLLRRLGWTRARAVQVLGQLERAGLVHAEPQRGGTAGRPRTLYRPVSVTELAARPEDAGRAP